MRRCWLAPVALLLVAGGAAAAPRHKKKKAEPAPVVEPAPAAAEAPLLGPELAPPPPAVSKPAPPPWRFTRGKLVVGARVGGVFAEPFGGLGASFLVDVEAGWALPRLPVVGEGFVLMLDLGYTQPRGSATATDPRVAAMGGSYRWSLVEHEVWLGFTVGYRLPIPILGGRLVPYAGLGPRLILLQSSISGEAGAGNPLAGWVERSTRAGFAAAAGADFAIGPGRVFFELGLVVAPFEQNTTGATDAGYLSLQAGYRVFL